MYTSIQTSYRIHFCSILAPYFKKESFEKLGSLTQITLTKDTNKDKNTKGYILNDPSYALYCPEDTTPVFTFKA